MNGAGAVERLATVEARWFAAGPTPAAVAAWFEAAGEVRREPARTDRYLRLQGVDGVGVKRREGRFEIKARCAGALGMVVWAGHPARLEAWLKWSAPLDALADDAVPPVDVAKTRRLVTRHGVQVELAELAAGDRRFWTFGLEGARAGDLEAVLASPWAAAAPPAAVAFAGGYPAWLDRIAPG